MEDLEQQVVDLQETVELLTLDKEQLTLDKELLEEQLLQAQDEIAALRASSSSTTVAPPVSGQADEVELRRLQDENAKLRDAVRKLHDLHEEAKQTLEEQKLELEIYSSELEELRAYKAQATAEIDELKQTVDSVSSFESMIEKLTNDNFDLSSSLADAKQTIQELEDAIEVNEELDQQQRDQIEADRKTIDSLQVSLHNLEQIMQEKDSTLHDVQKKLDAMRQKYYGEKQEVEKLQQSLSLGSQDHKEIEATLRENSVLRRQTEDLYLESWLLRGQLSNANLQRLRFQALYTRLNDYFGSTSYFMEENKLLNMEILGISTLSSGFEAVLNDVSSHQESVQAMQQLQTVKAVYDALLQQISKFALPIRKLMIDLTSSQVQEQASLERQSDFIYVKTEVVPALTTLVETLKTSLMLVVTNGVPESQDASNIDTISSVLEQGLLAILPPSGATGSSMAHATMDTHDSDPSTPTTSAVDGQTNESQYLERELSVETLYLMFSSLLESVCYQSETSSWSAAMSNQVLDTLRSIRIELDECVRVSYKAYTRLAAQPKYYRTLLNAMIELVRLFRATEPAQMVLLPFTTEEVHPSFKQVLTTLRSLRSDIAGTAATTASNTSSTSSTFDQSSTVALRYFPTIFLLTRSTTATTSSASGSSTSHGNETIAHSTMHVEQVGFLIERYWSLLLQGENELLVSSQTLSQHKGLTNVDVMSWKERVHHFRSVILSKLDMSPSGIAAQGSSEGGLFGEEGGTASSAGHNRSPFRAASTAESAGELKLWKRKVDMKEEELRQAMKQVAALQEAKDTLQQELAAALATAAATPSAGSGKVAKEATTAADGSSDDPVATIRRLQEEIKALEEAVDSLDKRYEDVVRENKALKAGSGGSGGGRPPLAGGASASTGASAATASSAAAAAGGSHHPKMPRTKTSLDLFEATKALVAGATSGSGGASTPNPSAFAAASRAPSPHVSSRAMTPTPGNSGASSFSFTSKASAVASADQAILGGCTPFEQHLLEQLKQWKRIALRRLTQSLRPLPEKRLRSTTSEDSANQLSETANAVILTDSALQIAIPKTQASPAGDCLAAYRALRLARVTQARLSPAEETSATSSASSRKPRRAGGPPSTLGHILYRLHKLPCDSVSTAASQQAQ
eukprot:gene7458-5362_t